MRARQVSDDATDQEIDSLGVVELGVHAKSHDQAPRQMVELVQFVEQSEEQRPVGVALCRYDGGNESRREAIDTWEARRRDCRRRRKAR